METVYDTSFAFTDLVAGQLLRVQLVPANDAGTGNAPEIMKILVT